MSDINIKKCPSCGAANMQEAGENRINCIQCGANLSLVVNKSGGLKKFLISILVFVLVSSAAFYYVSNKTEELLKEVTGTIKPEVAPNIEINQSVNAIPKLKKNVMTITSEQFKRSHDKQNISELKIVNSSEGVQGKDGHFWIVTIKNQTNNPISRPRVSLKFLNAQNEKIENYTAWSKLEQLPVGKETYVLIDLPQVPKEEYHTQLAAQSSPISTFDKPQQLLEIKDFSVTILDKKKKSFELSGTVYNPNNNPVNFAEIIAVGKDKQGKAIAYANAYATHTTIAAKASSPFKLKAEKYLTAIPFSWTLSSLAKK